MSHREDGLDVFRLGRGELDLGPLSARLVSVDVTVSHLDLGRTLHGLVHVVTERRWGGAVGVQWSVQPRLAGWRNSQMSHLK